MTGPLEDVAADLAPAFSPGDWVIYRPAHGDPEDGEVVRVSDSGAYVFVRYRGQHTAKATRPQDLEHGPRP